MPRPYISPPSSRRSALTQQYITIYLDSTLRCGTGPRRGGFRGLPGVCPGAVAAAEAGDGQPLDAQGGRVLFRVEEMLLHRYQEATGLCSSTRKVAASAPKWRRSPSERSSSTVWASPPPWSSTLPSTSHTKNTERVDSPRKPLWDCFQTKWRVKISLPEA